MRVSPLNRLPQLGHTARLRRRAKVSPGVWGRTMSRWYQAAALCCAASLAILGGWRDVNAQVGGVAGAVGAAVGGVAGAVGAAVGVSAVQREPQWAKSPAQRVPPWALSAAPSVRP
jgi:hypothetical protein